MSRAASRRGATLGLALGAATGAALALLLGACAPAHADLPSPAGDRAVTVADVATGRVAAGTPVATRGRCLADTTLQAAGGPPRTRSDWQLADAAHAVYVTGPRPAGCEPRTGSRDAVSVRATVAQDTLPSLGGAGRVRWYLVTR